MTQIQAKDLLLETMVQKSLAYLEKTDPDDIVVGGSDSVNYQIRYSRDNIIVTKRWHSLGLNFFYVKQGKIAATGINDVSSMDQVYKALDELIVFGKAIPPKPDWQGLAEGPFKYTQIPKTYDKRLLDFTDYAIDHVEQGLQAAVEAGAKHSAGVLQWRYSTQYLSTNRGVETSSQSTSIEYLIRSFLEPTESGQGLCVGRMLDSLDTEQAGTEAGTIARQAQGGKAGKAGTYHVLFSPTVVGDIIAQPLSVADSFSMEIGQSWLKDKMGETIASELFTGHDDAMVPNGFSSRVCDAEGFPSQRTTIIENGVLKNLIHNTTTAKKAGTSSTGNAGLISPQNSNCLIDPGAHSFDEMVAECKQPTIYVTAVWYTRTTSAAEGVFSTIPRDGMFLIENGEIQQPLRELRISDSYPNLLQNITAVQNKTRQIKWWVEVTTPTFAPAMLVENVTFTTGTR